MRILALLAAVTLVACAPRVRHITSSPVVTRAAGSAAAATRHVEWHVQVSSLERGAHAWRRLPRVVLPDDRTAEDTINADLEAALGGGGYSKTATLPDPDQLNLGDATTDCMKTVTTRDVVAFACLTVSMGAHPYEITTGLAYDLRPGRTKRLAARDIFSEAGIVRLEEIITARVRAHAVANKIELPSDAARLDPFELRDREVRVTFDRCSLGACINGGMTVTLSCNDLLSALRSDSPWRCSDAIP